MLTPPGPTRRPTTMRTIPRRTDPLTRATMPAITSTAAMTHRMVSVLPPPFAASIPRAPSMLPPFILWRTVAGVADPGEEGSRASSHERRRQAPFALHSTAPALSSRKRLLFGLDGRHGLLRPAALNVESIGVGRLESVAFDLVAASKGLHLRALGLLVAEVDRAQGALPQVGQVVD